MVSMAAMTVEELANYLVLTGSFTTFAEAVEALNIIIVEGAGAASTAISVTGGAASTAIGTIGETALEVAAEAQLAASGTGVSTSAIGLVGGTGGSVTATGLLGVELGVVAAAAAPLMGVSLGITMYESNPELWTKISQKLLPFCYPGTTIIPIWAEIANDIWQVSVLKSVVDALKELFKEENIPVVGDNTSMITITNSDYEGTLYANPATPGNSLGSYILTNHTADFYYCNDGPIMLISTNSAISYSYTYSYGSQYPIEIHDVDATGAAHVVDGNTYYVASTGFSGVTGSKISSLSDISLTRAIQLFYSPNSDFDYDEKEYQEGTSEWEGTTPREIPEITPGAVVRIDGGGGAVYEPLTPISIPYDVPEPSTQPKPDDWPAEVPYTQPVPSPDPELQPDPTVTDEPSTQVQPYIQPLPIPWETTYPTPDPEAETDPERDPSQPRPPTQIITEPPIDLGPEPIGISPWPAMPDTPSPFPLDGSAGLITVYNPTSSELYAFESWLWVTLSQASIQTVWNNPFDGVIGLFELYCTPTQNGHKTIRSGFLDSGINSATISRYTFIDCGTLGIPEYYGNYLDYSPYSKAHVYLPFIGIQELNVDDIVGHAVNITYRIDEYNGSCIAMITVAKVTEVNGEEVEYSNTMYQFSGNCAVELPISGGNQSSILAGQMMANAYQQASNIAAGAQLIGGIASTLGGLLSLNAGGIGSGISQIVGAGATQAYGQAQALSNMLSGKSTVQKSGSFGSSHGALGIKVPFITVTRPKQIQVPNYEDLYGFPAHKMVTIGACQGFLRCREVHVVSSSASDEEKAIIEQMLKSGVYVTE